MIPKFRAWHKTWEELGEVERIRFDDEGNVSTVLVIGKSFGANIYIDKIELMQTTGLKDKNGKEIFEGDILGIETINEQVYVSVFWDNKHALFMFKSEKYNESEALAELVEDYAYPFEIVGNVWENKELLEESNNG